MTTDEILAALERALNNDLLWWGEDAHGHTVSFQEGTCHGIDQALARVIMLRYQLTSDSGTDDREAAS